jgi:L-2-hydroxyglutarate oxidase LhgO
VKCRHPLLRCKSHLVFQQFDAIPSKTVNAQTSDFLIIGGGIIGVSIARELRRTHPTSSITVLEKELELGRHASGRNSGVLHAGFYYTADSLKARFTREGNIALTSYCEERGLPLNRCGKLVVARSESDHSQMDELLRRGQANGVPLDSITESEAKRIEPRVKTCERAIFSPTTATADPLTVLQAMREDAIAEGIRFSTGSRVDTFRDGLLRTSEVDWSAGYVVNAAGLHADQIAQKFGFAEHYRIVPFKGLYLYSDEPSGAFRTNIYPVPDLRNPFLGVHFTVTVDGRAKIGPTAIPAFWREQYEGLSNFDAADCVTTLWRELGLILFAGFDFKRLAVEELAKYNRHHLVTLAGELASGVHPRDYRRWGRAGIRAQLLDTRTRKLEMDFVLQGDGKSMHVLNAVSPGWTCSIPFAKHIVSEIQKRL